MSTLVLATSDTGAGHLKQERRADRVQWFNHRLVTGPVPVAGPPASFFQRRRALYERDALFHEPHWFDPEDSDCRVERVRRIWSTLPQLCHAHDRIELWVDPDPNAQLVMLQLLDWLGGLSGLVGRLWIKQSDSPLGERRAGDWVLPPRPVEDADLVLARRAWAAFGADTPEDWFALRTDPELDRLPGVGQAIERTLAELPDGGGLGATARRILSLTERQPWWNEAARRGQDISTYTLAEEERSFRRLLDRVQKSSPRVPLWYFELGELICALAAAPAPALSGPTETHFDSDLHQDQARRQRLYASPIVLTEFGRRLLAGEADWTDHNPTLRWIGGTRLAGDTLWRWDSGTRQLLPPAQS